MKTGLVSWTGGGKLIMVTGASDYISNPRAQMRLYERVVDHHGQENVDKSVRYYVMSNAGHGLSGRSAYDETLPANWDPQAALVNWVENGVAPGEAIVLNRYENSPPHKETGSRLMCHYPKYPEYKGDGDPYDSGSYTCAEP